MDEIEWHARRSCEHLGRDPEEMIEVVGCDDLTEIELAEFRRSCGAEAFASVGTLANSMPRWRSFRREAALAIVAVARLKAERPIFLL